jgi:hypothetical protein
MGAASAAIAGVGGIVKGITGARQASEARRAIESYQRQELTNVYGDLSVSTLGSDLQREELARATATGVEALQQAGVRGLIGGIGQVQAQNNLTSRQIAADLDMQQQQIDRLRAQDNATIRALQEQREAQDLAGLGQQLNVGQQNLFSGIGDVTRSFGAAAGMYTANQPLPQGREPGVALPSPIARGVNLTGTYSPQVPQQPIVNPFTSNIFL